MKVIIQYNSVVLYRVFIVQAIVTISYRFVVYYVSIGNTVYRSRR